MTCRPWVRSSPLSFSSAPRLPPRLYRHCRSDMSQGSFLLFLLCLITVWRVVYGEIREHIR
jgi:hypothetical protein